MAETPSSFTLKHNDKAPNFRLNDTNGKSIQLNDFVGKKALVIMFICNHCPFVKHCLLYTSPSPRDLSTSRMPSSA